MVENRENMTSVLTTASTTGTPTTERRQSQDVKRTTQAKQEKANLHDFEAAQKDFRNKMADQLKCLGERTEVQLASLTELNEFFRKRSEIEVDYATKMEKLAKSLHNRHTSSSRKDACAQHNSNTVWQTLVDQMFDESKKRHALGELYGKHLTASIDSRCEDLQKMSKRCREIGSYSHNELHRVLNELHTAMKTYQLCYAELSIVEKKKRACEEDKRRYEEANPQCSESSRKYRSLSKIFKRRLEKFEDVRLKCTKGRNEYLLCVKAANAALYRFFGEDLSYLIDCMDLGHDFWLRATLETVIEERKRITQGEMDFLAELGTLRASIDAKADKQRFFESNHPLFMLPKQFEFRPQLGDDVSEVSAEKNLSADLLQRQRQIEKRLDVLRFETDEVWKTLEAVEKQILALYTNGAGDDVAKWRNDLVITFQYYSKKFEMFLLNGNLMQRLEARSRAIGEALAKQGVEVSIGGDQNTMQKQNGHAAMNGNRSNRNSTSIGGDRKRRPKRIGGVINEDRPRPKLFGGSLEEYVYATGEEIPMFVVSAVRYLSRFSLRNQGLFRISGSQSEIIRFKEAYERGDDVFAELHDGSESNSVAGVLKLYLRELREPLFPTYLFQEFCDCAQLDDAGFIAKAQGLMEQLPASHIRLLRFLFSFLSHICEYADENMMEPHNMAICFGPTLLPIPEGKDQVFYHNFVNNLVRNLILHADAVFPSIITGPVYDKYALQGLNDDENEHLAYIEDGDPLSDDDDLNHANTNRTFNSRNGGRQEALNSMLNSTYDTEMTSLAGAANGGFTQSTAIENLSPRGLNDLESLPPSASSRSSNRSSNVDNFFRRPSDENAVSGHANFQPLLKSEMPFRIASELNTLFKNNGDHSTSGIAVLRHSNATPLWESNECDMEEEREYVSPPALLSTLASAHEFSRHSGRSFAHDYHEIDSLEDAIETPSTSSLANVATPSPMMAERRQINATPSTTRDAVYTPIQPRATTMPPPMHTQSSQSSIASSSNSVAGNSGGVRMIGKSSLRDQLQVFRKECSGANDDRVYPMSEVPFPRQKRGDDGAKVLDARGSVDKSESNTADSSRRTSVDDRASSTSSRTSLPKKNSADSILPNAMQPLKSASDFNVTVLRQPDVVSSAKPRAVSPTLDEIAAAFKATQLD